MNNQLISVLLEVISKELQKTEFQQRVLKPLVKSFISYIMPYIFFMIAFNIFLAVIAFAFVVNFIKIN